MKKFVAVMLVVLMVSCTTTGQVAQAAGNSGLLDKNVSDALGRMGEAITNANQDITPSEEYYIGRAVSANILSKYTLYMSNQQLTAYVNDILNTLVINSPRPDIYNGYHAAVLDTDEINGFSTSGGHIFITRGLLNCAGSEDALAAVIAHELAHIQLQHSISSIKNSRFTGALQQVAGIAAEAAGLDELTQIFDDSIREAVNTMIDSGYSREQEYEADAAALSLLAAAGYTPSSIVGMLESLKTNSANKQAYPSLGKVGTSTHPSPESRLAEVNKNLPRYKAAVDNTGLRKPRFDTVKNF
jgi:predicted Zn-dependent protease